MNVAIDSQIQGRIQNVISGIDKYSDAAECMAKNLMENRIVDRFYTPDLLFNPQKLKEELEPYLADAKSFCPTGWISKVKNFFG